jgi:exodeoxyribonuclease-3
LSCFQAKRKLFTYVFSGILITICSVSLAGSLRVLTFNLYAAGINTGDSIDASLEVIRRADADIVGLQETRAERSPCLPDECPPTGSSVASLIADQLHYNVYDQVGPRDALWANAILSRFPIVQTAEDDLGVMIETPNGLVWVFNLHLHDAPYQPYQAVGIEYGDAPITREPGELIASAERTRGAGIARIVKQIGDAVRLPVMIMGDFNEPSHLDWTEAAVAVGQQPLVVLWPASRTLAKLGFIDAYRHVHPNPVLKKAWTWTPLHEKGEPEKHDRIDFIYTRGLGILDAWILGEPSPVSDLVFELWPSDHRAVLVEIELVP